VREGEKTEISESSGKKNKLQKTAGNKISALREKGGFWKKRGGGGSVRGLMEQNTVVKNQYDCQSGAVVCMGLLKRRAF